MEAEISRPQAVVGVAACSIAQSSGSQARGASVEAPASSGSVRYCRHSLESTLAPENADRTASQTTQNAKTLLGSRPAPTSCLRPPIGAMKTRATTRSSPAQSSTRGMRLGGRAGAGRARSTPWLIRVPSRHDSSPPHLSDCGQARERVCAANRGNRFKLACIKGFRALCNGFAIAMPGSDRASDPSKPGVCHTERLYVEARMISTPVASIRKRARTSRRSSQGSGRTRSMSRIAGRLSSSGRRSGR